MGSWGWAGFHRRPAAPLPAVWMREEVEGDDEEEEEEGEWSKSMEFKLRAPQKLRYVCYQCGHQNTTSLLNKENLRLLSLHSSLETINLAVNETRKRRKRRRRRLTLSSTEDSPEYERLSSSSQMQTLDVRIKLTPQVVRETYGLFESNQEVDGEEGGGEGRGAQIYDKIKVRKNWGRYLGVESDNRGSSDSFSSESSSHESGDTGGSNSSKKASKNFFKLKMPLKCLNKVTSFSLFK